MWKAAGETSLVLNFALNKIKQILQEVQKQPFLKTRFFKAPHPLQSCLLCRDSWPPWPATALHPAQGTGAWVRVLLSLLPAARTPGAAVSQAPVPVSSIEGPAPLLG